MNRVIPEVQSNIKKFGLVYKNLLEKFIKVFYKGKKRGFIISQDFQDRINKVVEKI